MPQELPAQGEFHHLQRIIHFFILIKDLKEFAHSIAKENDAFIFFLKMTPKYNFKKSAPYI